MTGAMAGTPATADTWFAALTVPAAAADAVETHLDAIPELTEAGAVTRFEAGRDGVTFEFYLQERPNAEMTAAIAAAAGATPAFAPLAPEDWVRRSQQGLDPFRAGRFRVTPHAPAKRYAGTILMDAGQAFGTGHHETTKGCLLAIDGLLKRTPPARALDLGCGTGILAIAMAKAGARHVVASDNDPVAIRVAEENRRRNRVPAERMSCIISEGFHHPATWGRFDLIVANILARPLVDLAPAIARHLGPGGTVVLSGLLRSQEKEVLAAYQEGTLARRQHLRLGDWSTLVLRTGAECSRGKPARNGRGGSRPGGR